MKNKQHKDLELISGDFFDIEIPKNRVFLLKYFKTPVQIAFLKYYLVFGEIRNFTNHTGYYCYPRVAKRLQSRFRKLVELHEKAKSDMTQENLELLSFIEEGRYPLTKKKNS